MSVSSSVEDQTSNPTFALYKTLVSILSNPDEHPLEIEILPSSYPLPPDSPRILYEAGALAVLKKDLLSSFLHARKLLTAYLSVLPNPTPSSELISATLVLLFYDPEHITAANLRKRYLLENYGSNPTLPHRELSVMASFLSSPLPKHTKSPTLWYHRYWIIKNFSSRSELRHSKNHESLIELGSEHFLEQEIRLVLKAGDRHYSDYHGFHYGRRIMRLAISQQAKGEARGQGVVDENLVEEVRKWCFAHPRDISGWGFLAFLLMEPGGLEHPTKGRERVADAITAFVETTKWKGKSLEWFMKEIDQADREVGSE